MASDILSKSASKLNLSRRQTAILQEILLAGGYMAERIDELNQLYSLDEEELVLKSAWQLLMTELMETLI